MFNTCKQLLDEAGQVFQGENPEIFKYRFLAEEKVKMATFHFIFYGGFEVYVYSRPGL